MMIWFRSVQNRVLVVYPSMMSILSSVLIPKSSSFSYEITDFQKSWLALHSKNKCSRDSSASSQKEHKFEIVKFILYSRLFVYTMRWRRLNWKHLVRTSRVTLKGIKNIWSHLIMWLGNSVLYLCIEVGETRACATRCQYNFLEIKSGRLTTSSPNCRGNSKLLFCCCLKLTLAVLSKFFQGSGSAFDKPKSIKYSLKFSPLLLKWSHDRSFPLSKRMSETLAISFWSSLLLNMGLFSIRKCWLFHIISSRTSLREDITLLLIVDHAVRQSR